MRGQNIILNSLSVLDLLHGLVFTFGFNKKTDSLSFWVDTRKGSKNAFTQKWIRPKSSNILETLHGASTDSIRFTGPKHQPKVRSCSEKP